MTKPMKKVVKKTTGKKTPVKKTKKNASLYDQLVDKEYSLVVDYKNFIKFVTDTLQKKEYLALYQHIVSSDGGKETCYITDATTLADVLNQIFFGSESGTPPLLQNITRIMKECELARGDSSATTLQHQLELVKEWYQNIDTLQSHFDKMLENFGGVDDSYPSEIDRDDFADESRYNWARLGFNFVMALENKLQEVSLVLSDHPTELRFGN